MLAQLSEIVLLCQGLGRLFDLIEKLRRARVVDALENSILLERSVPIIHRDERHAEIVVSGRIIRLLLDGGLILTYCFGVATQLMQRVAHLVVSFRILRT